MHLTNIDEANEQYNIDQITSVQVVCFFDPTLWLVMMNVR